MKTPRTPKEWLLFHASAETPAKLVKEGNHPLGKKGYLVLSNGTGSSLVSGPNAAPDSDISDREWEVRLYPRTPEGPQLELWMASRPGTTSRRGKSFECVQRERVKGL